MAVFCEIRAERVPQMAGSIDAVRLLAISIRKKGDKRSFERVSDEENAVIGRN